MVSNLKDFVKENLKVMSALQRYSGYSKAQILDALSFGKGPTVVVEEMGGKFGYFNKNAGESILHIRASYVRGLEAAQLESTKEGTAFLLAVTILHEFVHLGTNANNINEGRYDFGFRFERDAFEVYINETNANQVVLDFRQYF